MSAHKTADSLPQKQLVDFCKTEGVSFDWLVLGNRESNVEHVNIADYNGFCDDLRYHDICEYLRENPDDRDAVHELIQAKRSARKATEKFLKG